MNEGWNVIIRYDEEFAGLNIWFVHKEGGINSIVSPFNMEIRTTVEPGVILPEPTIRLTEIHAKQFLQGLANALAMSGFRPDELKAKDSELKATKYHLEDMRKIVFEALAPPELTPQLPKRQI